MSDVSKLVETLENAVSVIVRLSEDINLTTYEAVVLDDAREALSSFKAETGVDADGRDDGDRKFDDLLAEEPFTHVKNTQLVTEQKPSLWVRVNEAVRRHYWTGHSAEAIADDVYEVVLSALSKDALASGPQDTTAHTVEREKGYREGIEAAAKVAETAGPAHYASQHKGLTRHTSEAEAFIARRIRSLSSERPADIADRSDSASPSE